MYTIIIIIILIDNPYRNDEKLSKNALNE